MDKKLTKEYFSKIIEKHATGHAREHSYRPALEELFREITGLKVVNEPKRSEYGAPDFVFIDKNIVAAYAEAKDVNISLAEVEKSEQMIRYYGYSNLILTNCLEFRFYKNGLAYGQPIIIGSLKNGKIEAEETNFGLLENTIKDFIKDAKEPIKSGLHLAKVMAGKGRRIRDNIRIYLKQADDPKNADLLSIYEVIKRDLLADLDLEKFADLYAQTVVYGLFAARYSDSTLENFTRREALDLIPPTNPFLREFFSHIAGSSYDERIKYIVDELCEEFNHADLQAIIHNYYKTEKDSSRDPIIHFYEDFLQFYDAAERKKMGVFYTPLPVAHFIVRALDNILKKEFGLAGGLADTAKIEVKRESQGKKYKETIHKVQILDPATGTGTFLNEVIMHIKKAFAGQEGRWKNYVSEDLLPRLHGFELMMASYTIAHLKLSSTIKESGAELVPKKRIGVYLTNSLEAGEKEDQTLFTKLGLDRAISEESRQAGRIKNDTPIMVVLGNPPYSVSSQNKGKWITELTAVYKKDLNEKNIQPLSDDYIKFIRLAEYLVEKNQIGVIGMITNNSFLDGIIHRQMRKHLLETFDSIYILDLHGNSKKKEIAPDGSKDENVFNIMQGVSISLFIKAGKKKKGLANVYHVDFYGKQKEKFKKLDKANLEFVEWQKLGYKDPYNFFVPKNFKSEDEYSNGFKIDELFSVYNAGAATGKDSVFVQCNSNEMIKNLLNIGKADLQNKIVDYLYRPFDIRKIPYDNKVIQRLRTNVMDHMLNDNVAIVTCKKQTSFNFQHVLISKLVTDRCAVSLQTGEVGYVFPLYLYADGKRVINFNQEIYKKIIENIKAKVEPENVLDYIYTVLHSPTYREKYKEFLKIDFPRVPYPKNESQFFALVKLGEELRHLHLMDDRAGGKPASVETRLIASLRGDNGTDAKISGGSEISPCQTTYPIAGDNMIEKVRYDEKEKCVYINKAQYFGNVPKTAWEFYVGGYQPAQKWLKDRKGRELSSDDIVHYQKIIVALLETDRIMGEIDKIFVF